MREEFFRERGLNYRISDLRSNRHTLVFLHGLSGSVSAWFPYEQRFEDSHNIVTVDLRGHGKSLRWRRYDAHALSLFAEDIALLLRHLSIREHTLIGHSFGTLVALKLLEREHSAKRAILLSPNYAVHRMLRSRLTRHLLGLFVGLFSHLPSIHWVGKHVDYSKLGYTTDWDIRRLYADIRNTGIRTYLYCLHHVYSFTRDDDWKRIAVPTLVLHGALDSFVPVAHAIELAGMIPGAKFEMLRNANHMLVLNNVKDVSRIISDFVSNRDL